MLIKGQKVSGTSQKRSSLNNSFGGSKIDTRPYQYPGIIAKPRDSLKMTSSIFDNSILSRPNEVLLEHEIIVDHMISQTPNLVNNSYSQHQPTELLQNDLTDQSTQGQMQIKAFQDLPLQQQLQQQSINLPQIKLNNNSQNSYPQVQGIGPNGMELTQFFSNSSKIKVQSSPKNETIFMHEFQPHYIHSGGASNNQTQMLEFSPDNTQYTILKAKLFNPNIKDEGTTMSNKVIQPGKEKAQVIHSQQYQLTSSQNYNSGSFLPSQYQHQQPSQLANFSKNAQIMGLRTQKTQQFDLGKHIRHKKDMQQLKFYQTLTNQPNQQGSTVSTGPAGHVGLNNSLITANQNLSFVGSNNNMTFQSKSTSQPPGSRGKTLRSAGKNTGTVINPYINIQSQYTLKDKVGQRPLFDNAGTQVTSSRPQTTAHNQLQSRRDDPLDTNLSPKQQHVTITEPKAHNDTFSQNATGPDLPINNHEKSYTQLMSDQSREQYIPLKSNMNSKEHIATSDIKNTEEGIKSFQGRNEPQISENELNGSQSGVAKRRQMISIEKVEKKRVLSDSIDYHQNNNSSLMMSNHGDQHIIHNQSMIVDEHYHQIQPYSNQAYAKSNTRKDTTQMDIMSYEKPAPVQNLIIKRCEMQDRPADQQQQTKKLYTLRKSMKGQKCHGKSKEPEKEDLFKAESQLVIRKSIQNEKLEKIRSLNHHQACQRFLERGNKPVPPNYEEQDVFPSNIDLAKEAMAPQHHSQAMLKSKSPSSKLKQFQQRNVQGGGLTGGGTLGINLEEFDEEINGINLGKLFSVYGPNSVEHKKFQRRRSALNLSRDLKDSARDLKSGRSTSLQRSHANNLEIKHKTDVVPSAAPLHHLSDDDKSPSQSDQKEQPTIVIRLMSNMFSKKKSVKERLQMIPSISVEKLKKELQSIKMQERVNFLKQRREEHMWDRINRAEKIFQKLPNVNQSLQEVDLQQLKEQENLKNNPFYLALKENKDQREKIQQLRKLKREQDEVMRIQAEMELRKKAQEGVKTDIFQHTFVDCQEELIEQEIKGDILNRPAKDVFTFMNLNFDLPIAYYHSFGDFRFPTDVHRTLIKDFMLQHWPILRTKRVNFKIAFDKVKQVFNTILMGKNCPLSRCCKMTVCFQFDREIHGGKVICNIWSVYCLGMETLCPYNPLDQFFMQSEVIEQLYALNHKQQLLESLKLSHKDQRPKVNKQNFCLYDFRVLSSEISRSIQKGNYKNLSLRDILQKQNLPKSRKKKDQISQLYSLEESSNYNIMLDEQDADDEYQMEQDQTIQEEEEIPNSQHTWKDIEPVKQYEEGQAPIYEQVMGYFRAILLKKEVSMRAYNLTEEVLHYNPGDYNAWLLRRQIIDELKIPLDQEMMFLLHVGILLEKNFQIWHHRRCIMELHQKDFDQERDFLYEIFQSDKKNYHAWSYRLWFIERFQLFDEEEFEFVNEELQDDVTNNSLWSYRYFLLNKTQPFTKDFVRSEIQYTLKMLNKDLTNEAAWVYLKGYLASSQEEALQSQKTNAKRIFILEFTEDLKTPLLNLLNESDMNRANRFIYLTLLEFSQAEGNKEEQLKYLELLKNIDRMRVNYYQWRINKINQ